MRLAAPFPALFAVVLAALGSTVAGCAAVGSVDREQAACAVTAPVLEAEPARAAAGGAFELRADGFYEDFVCNDSRSPGERPDEPSGPVPADEVRIELVQGERTWNLSTVSSDEDLAFEVRLEVPDGARPGRAEVRATAGGIGTAGGMDAPVTTSFLVLDPLPDTGGS